jgi:glycerol-3-phosphate acyltransferase PlsX
MIGALLVAKPLTAFKKKYDYKEYGGAPLLGISKPVIKAHGSSDANAVKHAVKQAIVYSESGVIEYLSGLNIRTADDELV